MNRFEPLGIMRLRLRRCRSPLDTAREQAADEIALQGEEHDQRHDDRDESAGGQQVPDVPRVPASSARRTVNGATSSAAPAKVSATSRSFHTQRNWKMPNAAMAGRAAAA